MQHGQLMSHVDTDLVTREQLRVVAAPAPTVTFKLVPHAELIDTLDGNVTAKLRISRCQGSLIAVIAVTDGAA